MLFRDKLKKEREERGWSQDRLAEKIYVSRQSISKWETGKNYPSIELIIELSDLFDITIDELLRSDEDLTEKIIQDSKQQLGWQSYILIGLGVLIGIVLVSLITHQGINWISIGRATGLAALLFIFYFLFRQGAKRVKQNK
ncbi:helix-turn-helix domain-containing protein [Virgibacillus pantothenticus]|uniref:DNA-binding protein n=1 Tax=Virgibacillus pantothenticus TaxID=1473 RepID=A0A0L0QWX6_VIRPA|nr:MULTISPECIES: helix-turn-helix transcriptional regulator [Virgibacillus]API94245.1 transcriptional regulator [Virgibacillus sp. 6R]KNE22718.1 DNA-binding protein [Virgibacillus pantothenticus]MBS7427354.1 helix-turn-helix transcriptional regulator [Virgibacillus sp. 19R1-5]MBU8566992.1 helix-turn-helix domain-containing protein [Virgibacillus pantothenticus]MBU8602568.1 helix-turn-helix domain-containing protein [Virgibacillus pantothenticus]